MQFLSWSIAAALSIPAALPAAARQGEYFQDARYGFKIKPPAGWEQIPVAADQTLMVAKYVCDKAYFVTDKTLGYTFEHKPEMRVVALVQQAAAEGPEDGGEAEESPPEGAGDPGGAEEIPDEVSVALGANFKDYVSYMRATYQTGGWHVEEEEALTHKQIEVTSFSILVERSNWGGPRRIITWVFHLEGVDLAVQFEAWDDAYPKLKSAVTKALKSFEEIPRSGGALAASTVGTIRISLAGLKDLSPAERAAKLQEFERRDFERAKQSLPPDWTAVEIDGFAVLNHADDKHARKVVDQAAAVMSWLDRTFD